MGFIRVKVRVSNPSDHSKYRDCELLVDTGVTFTLIPGTILEEIGIKPDTKFKLKTADGRFIERDGSTVHIEIESKGYKVPVIFGEKEDALVLGVTTLEILGLEVDPITRKLKPTEYLLLQSRTRQQ